ncbi:penicillin-binding protein 1A [Magnetospirillum sp. SS-4]|uniref:penicillin-binding protein 1A n=1 Tax=Magnetospirillum sp. SS-4 TaxID=2681465 RepID=UPI001383493C|nr:penicillin-binding protein 1A [Magnetospirillum sp. SS-4]CAA7624757.1 Penicillin-binding protein 1A (Includes: Penicillin-insensitive transglycosylase; Penicillin-sensitive transpeptidase) [Magnetospirillum sp. SS-4]
MLRFLVGLFSFLLLLGVIAAGGIVFVFWHFGRDLPDYHQLAHYEPPITTRVYGGDGRLVAEYAVEKRVFVPLHSMPQVIKDAFLAAEDKNFYSHPGIDPVGIARAIVVNLRNRGMGGDRRPVGASTITQQVAKNFLLTNEVSIERKVKEAILAFRIERTFSKDHILELYLNEIYLGVGSYGVAAAALNYFDKGLDELSIHEAAYLAALPKAPNNYNPHRNYAAAKERRDWVIGRMYEDGRISQIEYQTMTAMPLEVRTRKEMQATQGADYFAEDIRREIQAKFGETALYKGGLVVRASMDAHLQAVGSKLLRQGLTNYDRRHGWRGPLTRIPVTPNWPQLLAGVPHPPAAPETWEIAVVTGLNDHEATLGLLGNRTGKLPFAEMKWARPALEKQMVGPMPRRPSDVLGQGDVILVEAADKAEDGKAFALRQIPKVEGALVAIDPHTGRVLAMVGGWAYGKSQFNRASQALRQPGSSFKPFIYLAALENGYTPSSLVLDAPIALPQGPGLPLWRPKNYNDDFLGPTTLRVGLEKSRNLMTVRLAQAVTMEKVADYAERFGIYDKLPHQLAMSLGAGETTPLKLTAAYAMLVNGGKRIRPTLIDRIQDRNGKTIFSHDLRFCDGCSAQRYSGQDMPHLPDIREQLVDPVSAYQMVSIMEGVVQRGTGTSVRAVGKPLAGKTGTSNDSNDVWFVGFSPDLAVGVFVGFDDPATLGPKETGGSIAAPIFRDFMAEALKDKPPTPFRVPPGVRLVRVNASTGKPAMPGEAKAIYEAFKSNDPMPSDEEDVLEGSGSADSGFSFAPYLNAEEGAAAPADPSAPRPAGTGAPPPQPAGPAPSAGGLY